MFKRTKKTRVKTPKFRPLTVPPQYNPPPMPSVKPPNKGSNVQPPCTYKTPCGWCTKWEKKCDKSIGGGNDIEPRKKKDAFLEQIKSGKLPPLDTNNTYRSGITRYE